VVLFIVCGNKLRAYLKNNVLYTCMYFYKQTDSYLNQKVIKNNAIIK
jgi:hypothetical protein